MKYSHLFLAAACISNASLVPAIPVRLQDASHHLGPALTTGNLHAQFESDLQILGARSLSDGGGDGSSRQQQEPQGSSSAPAQQTAQPHLGRQQQPRRRQQQQQQRGQRGRGRGRGGRRNLPSRQQEPQGSRISSAAQVAALFNAPWDLSAVSLTRQGRQQRVRLTVPRRSVFVSIPPAPNGRRERTPRSPFSDNATPEPKTPPPESESTSSTHFDNRPPLLRTPSPSPPRRADPMTTRLLYNDHIQTHGGINLDEFLGTADDVRVLSRFPDGVVHNPLIVGDQFNFQREWHDLPSGGFPRVAYGESQTRSPSRGNSPRFEVDDGTLTITGELNH